MKRLLMLMVTIVGLLLVFGCTPHHTEIAAGSLKKQLKKIPENTVAVGYSNFKKLKASPFLKNMILEKQNIIMKKSISDSLRKYLGLDPMEDIQSVFMALVPAKTPEKVTVIAEINGRFDVSQMEKFLKSDSLKGKILSQNLNNGKLYWMKDKHHRYAFVIQPDKIVFGEKSLVEDYFQKKPSDTVPEIIEKQISNIVWPNDAWLIVDGARMSRLMSDLEEVKMKKKNLKGIRDFSSGFFNIGINEAVRLKAVAEFKNEDTADLVTDMLKGFVATAKLSVAEERELVDIVNQMKIDKKGRFVRMEGNFTNKQLRKLQKMKNKNLKTVI